MSFCLSIVPPKGLKSRGEGLKGEEIILQLQKKISIWFFKAFFLEISRPSSTNDRKEIRMGIEIVLVFFSNIWKIGAISRADRIGERAGPTSALRKGIFLHNHETENENENEKRK